VKDKNRLTYSAITPEILAALRGALGEEVVSTHPDKLTECAEDASHT